MSGTDSFSKPEPPPKRNDGPALWDLVVKDLEDTNDPSRHLVITDARERDEFGAKKYGTRLQANNGRNALRDAYQELLDAAVYFKQDLVEKSDSRIRAVYDEVLTLLLYLRPLL